MQKTIRNQIASLFTPNSMSSDLHKKPVQHTHLLRLMQEQGVMVDAVSLGEIERAIAAGYQPGNPTIRPIHPSSSPLMCLITQPSRA